MPESRTAGVRKRWRLELHRTLRSFDWILALDGTVELIRAKILFTLQHLQNTKARRKLPKPTRVSHVAPSIGKSCEQSGFRHCIFRARLTKRSVDNRENTIDHHPQRILYDREVWSRLKFYF